ncbi:condensation domain-containing protein [Streptosporangium canum]|nr:condensation domain-containing protein [Streptosporangium canum]
MLNIWRDVLKVDSVGVNDTFFTLGGDSLSALELNERIQESFGVRLRLRQIFDNPSVNRLSELVAASAASEGAGAGTGETADGEPAAVEFPLALGQEYFWRLATEMPDATFFVQCTELHCTDVDTGDLLGALQDVVRRQSALRCTFHVRDGHPMQRIEPDLEVPVTVIDHEGADADADRIALIAQATLKGTATPFDLGSELPIRASLLRFGPRESSLLVFTHHISFDGLSRQIFVQDLVAAYRARRGGPAPRPRRGSFVEFVTDQRKRMTDGVVARTVEFWREQFEAGAPDVLLRGGKAEGRGTYRTRTLNRTISRDAVIAATEFARANGVTLFTVLLAAFHQVVSDMSGQWRIPVAVQVANRSDVRQRGMIGPFANTLVVVGPDGPSDDVASQVRIVERRLLDVVDAQEVPLELAVDMIRATTPLKVQRQLRLGFTLNERSVKRVELPDGVIVADLRVPPETERIDPTTFDLVVEVRPDADRLAGILHHKADVYSQEIVDEFWQRWETYLLEVRKQA